MPVSESQKKSRNKWDAENMQIVACKIRKDVAAEFKAVAKVNGTTPNELLRTFIFDYIGKPVE